MKYTDWKKTPSSDLVDFWASAGIGDVRELVTEIHSCREAGWLIDELEGREVLQGYALEHFRSLPLQPQDACKGCGDEGVYSETFADDKDVCYLAEDAGGAFCTECQESRGNTRLLDANRTECDGCGCSGVEADTSWGDILSGGEVVANALGEKALLGTEGNTRLCSECLGHGEFDDFRGVG